MTASIDGGVVTLTGRAEQSAHVRLAENALREIVGVVDVVDRVDVDALPAERGTFDSAGAPSAGG
jgi:hypothetical protein